MARCKRCGTSLLFASKTKLQDAVLCTSCSNALQLYRYYDLSRCRYDQVKYGYEPTVTTTVRSEPVTRPKQKEYFFLVHDLDEEFVEKYRKQEIDKEDRYEGMSFNDMRAECDDGDKIYKYPELDVYLEFKESTLDGNPALEVYLDDHMVGYVPKTKVSRTKKLLADDKVSWSAELYGGDYRILKGTYVDEWFDKVNIRVTFTWSEKISEK